MTFQELDIVCNAAYVAYANLTKGRALTREERDNMMKRLGRASRIVERESKRETPVCALHLEEHAEI